MVGKRFHGAQSLSPQAGDGCDLVVGMMGFVRAVDGRLSGQIPQAGLAKIGELPQQRRCRRAKIRFVAPAGEGRGGA